MPEFFKLWKKVVCHACGCNEFYFQKGALGDCCYHCRRCDKAAIPEEAVADGRIKTESQE